MPGYYANNKEREFSLFRSPGDPAWRAPQSGALGAILGHWSVSGEQPALVALPTGAGKTAVAMAVAHLAAAERVLVVVPSKQLRDQVARAFSSQNDLRRIGALAGIANPQVLPVTGRVMEWRDLEPYDVIVGLPQSVSPAYYEGESKPPTDFFDLVVVDEAHHAPAPTWLAILEHFDSARKVLLTATPKRRDDRRVPGDLIFHYPVRRAISEGFYQPVKPRLVPVETDQVRRDCDLAIRDAVIKEMKKPEHASSALLIRAGSRSRVNELVALYSEARVDVVPLTANMAGGMKAEILQGLHSGTTRAVAVVGMLGEGFDLPRLRLVAYHDKNKSVGATVQLIGRLARSHPHYPQPSVLVTARDSEVFPSLQGALVQLYREDADWSSLLPGVIDDQIDDLVQEREFAKKLTQAPSQLSLESLRPRVQATVYESRREDWLPGFANGEVPDGVAAGEQIGGRWVIYATVTPGTDDTLNSKTLVIVTHARQSPSWHAEPGLDSDLYSLHLVTFVQGQSGDKHPLLLANFGDGRVQRAVLKLLGISEVTLRPADPKRLHGAFDALSRKSVSNVGVRNTYAGGRGQPSYKMFAGSGVDSGIREADTAQGAIGHAMAQVEDNAALRNYTSGVALGRSRFWESRWVPLRTYDEAMADFARRYWSDAESAKPLLPAVARGSRLAAFPDSQVAAVEMNPRLLGLGWRTSEDLQVDRLDIRATRAPDDGGALVLEAVVPHTEDTVWHGNLNVLGEVVDKNEALEVSRGQGTSRSFAELLTRFPPTVYFADGHTTVAGTVYRSRSVVRDLSRWDPIFIDWTQTNITKETDKSAMAASNGQSVHETLRGYLKARKHDSGQRWILENDGSGEIADLIVLEISDGQEVTLELWHAKPAGGTTPAVRITDMQVVVAQAIKSRRWLVDDGVWEEMGKRLMGEVSPKLSVVEGDEDLLKMQLGCLRGDNIEPLPHRPYLLRGKVVIAQPGLSWSEFETSLKAGKLGATQIRDLLATFDDSLGPLGESMIACSR